MKCVQNCHEWKLFSRLKSSFGIDKSKWSQTSKPVNLKWENLFMYFFPRTEKNRPHFARAV